MTSFDPRIEPPSFLSSAISAVARHLMTLATGWLITMGAIDKDQSAQLVQIGAGIAVWALAYAWSLIEKRNHAAVQNARVAQAAVR